MNPPNGVSKAKLKNNGDKASHYFKPFLMANMSEKDFSNSDSDRGFIQPHFY
jgi:hypothetical protein